MATLFATERIIVRDWVPKTDAEQAFEIYGDREVMQFIGDGSTEQSIESVRDRLQERIDDNELLYNGIGFWAVVERETQQAIGSILLKRLPDKDNIPTEDFEIGWHFRKASWGKGYATEAARGIITFGFDRLKLPVLYAVVKPENERSIRVTQRLGMTPMGKSYKYYGVELLLFQLTNQSSIF
jgi:RimJ/RimL family protein N-acetyltransferase